MINEAGETRVKMKAKTILNQYIPSPSTRNVVLQSSTVAVNSFGRSGGFQITPKNISALSSIKRRRNYSVIENPGSALNNVKSKYLAPFDVPKPDRLFSYQPP